MGKNYWEESEEEIEADPDELVTIATNHVPTKAKSFHNRPVYQDLESHGLVCLPPASGAFLSYHSESCQWHGGYPNPDGLKGHTHRAPKWADGLRTEHQALLMALRFLWHVHSLRTGNGKDHLAKLDAALKKHK